MSVFFLCSFLLLIGSGFCEFLAVCYFFDSAVLSKLSELSELSELPELHESYLLYELLEGGGYTTLHYFAL